MTSCRPTRYSPRWPNGTSGVRRRRRGHVARTYIRSPIDGVVVSRNVDVGRSVAASLQAPVLFLIAQDLTKMQVLADIDEADVGQLSPDSKVSFTVDAFPTETFEGTIDQIRRAARGVNGRIQHRRSVAPRRLYFLAQKSFSGSSGDAGINGSGTRIRTLPRDYSAWA